MTSDSDGVAPKNRGLLVIISVLLVAVIALAIGLVFALGGKDDAAVPETTVGAPAQTVPPRGPGLGDGGQGAGRDSTPPRDGTGRLPTDPLDAEASQELLLEQATRDPDDPYARGDADADIVIVQYADYRCWYCAQWHVEVSESLEPYIESGQVRIEYRDHPVRGDASVFAALAARAAGEQDLFWEYRDALYQDVYDEVGAAYDGTYFDDVARRVGVPDVDKFQSDMADADSLADIMASREQALSLGITGTPTFIVHDTLVPGALPEDQFLDLMESRLT
ncbi:DsbA family protein [Flaviflexus huanghaiensis]|uniref:DsbA family protein n=1 Tax=Flaviflexus huanghaiensis TaxID=1111473 RepID=UPI001F50CCBD|nr:thioredoxin domain-containing protein [Flaviflexus huanghaiensis]